MSDRHMHVVNISGHDGVRSVGFVLTRERAITLHATVALLSRLAPPGVEVTAVAVENPAPGAEWMLDEVRVVSDREFGECVAEAVGLVDGD